MARPRKHSEDEEKEIARQVRLLSGLHCTWSEIAAVVDEDFEYIRKRFSQDFHKGRETGKMRLRKLLWDSANKGNLGAQIWLSKNILGYSDKMEQSVKSDAVVDDGEKFRFLEPKD